MRKTVKKLATLAIAALVLAQAPVQTGAEAINQGESIAVLTLKSNATIGENNALRKAKEYLRVMPLSRKGLINQLKFEGFSNSEAKYGADKCGANWKKQAVKKAKSYLDMMGFSKDGLIKQLEFDGFTNKQAVYGAKKNGF